MFQSYWLAIILVLPLYSVISNILLLRPFLSKLSDAVEDDAYS